MYLKGHLRMVLCMWILLYRWGFLYREVHKCLCT